MNAVREDRAPMLRAKHGDKDMDLPEGRTCADCAHFTRCSAMFGHIAADEACDWAPSRFRLSTAVLEHEARYGRELGQRLDELMRRMREERFTPSYSDLRAVRGDE